MTALEQDYSHIPGWGIDADPDNDPTRPLKRHVPGEHDGLAWERPPQQPAREEVLRSNERPNLSAVFGTSAPPAGLSGALRRYAFRHSESSYGHWLPLMLADRIDEVEGLADDVARGRVPNIFEERGWRVEWEHNRAALVERVLAGAALACAAVALLPSLVARGHACCRKI